MKIKDQANFSAVLTVLIILCSTSFPLNAQILGRSIMDQLLPFHIYNLPDSVQPRITLDWHTGRVQTQGCGSRLLAERHIDFDTMGSPLPSDSVVYRYSAGRGGDLTKDNPLLFDTLSYLRWNAGTSSWEDVYYVIQAFDSNSKRSSSIQLQKVNGIWINKGREEWYYNTLGLDSVVREFDWSGQQNNWLKISEYQTRYNVAGLPVSYTYKYWDANFVVQLFGRDSFTYTSGNLLSGYFGGNLDTVTDVLTIMGGTVYYYLPSGQISRLASFTSHQFPYTWDTVRKFEYYYDSQQHLVIKRDHVGPPGAVDEDSFFVSSHTSSGLPLVVYWYNNPGPGPYLGPIYRSISSYTTHELLAEEVLEQVDTLVPYFRQRCKYNSLGQRTHDDYEYGINGTFYPELSIRYYYDLNNTHVSARNSSPFEMSLSPLPANEYLSLQLILSQKQQVYCYISNMAGQQMLGFKEEASNNSSRRISTANLPDGIYILSVFCGDGSRGSKIITIVH